MIGADDEPLTFFFNIFFSSMYKYVKQTKNNMMTTLKQTLCVFVFMFVYVLVGDKMIQDFLL